MMSGIHFDKTSQNAYILRSIAATVQKSFVGRSVCVCFKKINFSIKEKAEKGSLLYIIKEGMCPGSCMVPKGHFF